MISYLSPNLTTLTLGMCGRMRDLDIKKLVKGCPHLTNLELDGPFLCTDSGISELAQLSKLDSLSISNAAKITHESFSYLVNTLPLQLLKLRHCTSVGNGIGTIINSFSKLQELRLEFIGDLTQDEIVMVIKNGGKLKTLCLEGFMNLTDTCLEQIAISCTSLSTLSVGGCEQLSNKGLCSFFQEFKPLLNSLSLNRVTSLEDDSLLKLISRQSGSLTDLDINGLDKLTNQSLKNLGSISNLKYVDLSWIRNVDNDLLDSLLMNCQLLSILKVYGCNRLTDDKLNLLHTNSIGQKLQIHGNEFD
jgi:DNA repair protein RAD7